MTRVAHIAAMVVAVFLLLSGCISHREVYATDVDARAWSVPATVTVPNADSLTLRDISVFVRSNDGLSADSLTLYITLLTPDSLRYEDQLFIVLPRSQSPAAIAQETRIPYRRRVRLARTGNYRMTLTPQTPVTGIEAIGIHLEKSN